MAKGYAPKGGFTGSKGKILAHHSHQRGDAGPKKLISPVIAKNCFRGALAVGVGMQGQVFDPETIWK